MTGQKIDVARVLPTEVGVLAFLPIWFEKGHFSYKKEAFRKSGRMTYVWVHTYMEELAERAGIIGGDEEPMQGLDFRVALNRFKRAGVGVPPTLPLVKVKK